MTPREIIAEAWALSKREKGIRRWGFFSSFFETLLTVKLIGYQLYFLNAYLNGHKVGLVDDFEWMYYNLPLWLTITVITTFGILLLIEFIIPNMAAGAIIGLSAKAHIKQKTDGGTVLALYNFFPILGVHETLVLSSWTMALSACSLILRYIGGANARLLMLGFVIFFWFLSNILKFFFSFAPSAIVIDRQGVFHAMGTSFKLVIGYLGQVMFLVLLLFAISLRVLFNTAAILLIPAIMVGTGLLLAHVFSPLISFAVAAGLGMVLIVIASYFFGYLHVFQEAVWTITYMELSKRQDLLAVHPEDKERRTEIEPPKGFAPAH